EQHTPQPSSAVIPSLFLLFFVIEDVVSSEIHITWGKKGFCCNIKIFRKIQINHG
uniref:Uncharacterized protein n=1 Tax=Bubo bubo TaxID=30461 RepID=A0A8C0ECM7_BUBBB